MADLLQIKGIKPKKMNIAGVRLALLNALRAEGRISAKEFQKLVEGWKGDKPSFESIISLQGGNAAVLTGPTGNQKGIDKFRWLNDGTSVRWAVMSPDWKSKTKPGVLRSGGGRGRVIIAGRRAMSRRNIRPRPGIRARNWTATLQKRRKTRFTQRMIRAVREGAQKLY